MSVKVNFNSGSGGGGIMNSPALGLGLTAAGAFTGNPALIAGGLSRTKGPVGKAAGMYSLASSFGGGGSAAGAAENPAVMSASDTMNNSVFGANGGQSSALGEYGSNPTESANTLGGSAYDDYFNSMKRRMASYGGGY